jgi:hypothetical protein
LIQHSGSQPSSKNDLLYYPTTIYHSFSSSFLHSLPLDLNVAKVVDDKIPLASLSLSLPSRSQTTDIASCCLFFPFLFLFSYVNCGAIYVPTHITVGSTNKSPRVALLCLPCWSPTPAHTMPLHTYCNAVIHGSPPKLPPSPLHNANANGTTPKGTE